MRRAWLGRALRSGDILAAESHLALALAALLRLALCGAFPLGSQQAQGQVQVRACSASWELLVRAGAGALVRRLAVPWMLMVALSSACGREGECRPAVVQLWPPVIWQGARQRPVHSGGADRQVWLVHKVMKRCPATL